jgi:hypothetical protein
MKEFLAPVVVFLPDVRQKLSVFANDEELVGDGHHRTIQEWRARNIGKIDQIHALLEEAKPRLKGLIEDIDATYEVLGEKGVEGMARRITGTDGDSSQIKPPRRR